MFLDRNPTLRIIINTVIIILALAIVIGSIILIVHMLDVGSPDDSEESSDSDTADTAPDTDEEETTDDTEKSDSDDSPNDTEKSDESSVPDSESDDETTTATPEVGETLFDEPKTMYALYNVNARMNPTTNSDIYGLYYQGDEITVTGETENGWYRVDWRGYTAYIRNDLLTSDAPAASVTIEDYDPAVIMYAQTNVNVREGHTTSSTKITMIDIGTEVTVTGKTSNGWYRIDYNGSVAYISEKYLSKNMPEIPAETDEPA